MDFYKCKEEFEKYITNFDMNNGMINRKYYHTYRVVDYAEQICKSENLNAHDLNLAKVCALLHDIARFRQAIEYETFNDNLSFDHGDVGFNILIENDYISNYLNDEEDKKVCLKAVKNHNKYAIEKGLSDRELYFSKLVRDSDKLDIMNTQKNVVEDGQSDIISDVIEALRNGILYHKDKEINTRNNVSTIVLQLCFIYDFNFKESFKIINDKGILKRKVNILRENCNGIIVDEIEKIINSYVSSKI